MTAQDMQCDGQTEIQQKAEKDMNGSASGKNVLCLNLVKIFHHHSGCQSPRKTEENCLAN